MRQPLSQVLGTWIHATLVAPAAEPLALDGKTVRGARSGEQTAPHLLAFCSQHSQETLWQGRGDETTNAIPVAQAVLPPLPMRHRVCTAAAFHPQTDFMRLIPAQQAQTVLTVTGHHPTRYADLTTSCADPLAALCKHRRLTADQDAPKCAPSR